MSDNNKKGFWRATGEYLGLVEESHLDIRNTEVSETRAASSAVLPPVRPTYSEITPDGALQIGAVYRAVNIIVTSVSQMRIEVLRDGKKIPTPALVRQPNVMENSSSFIEETTYSLAVHGNAYWRVFRGSNGQVASLEVLDPSVVGIRKDKGKKVYYIGTQDFAAKDIKHLKLMRKPGQDLGFGPIQSGSKELQAALRLHEFGNQWYDVSTVPTGALTTDLVLNAEDKAAMADAWKEFLRTHGGTAILDNGLSYTPFPLNPKDAQFIEVQKNVIVGIARLFGIPASDLMAELGGTSMTYQNIEQANITFLQKTLSRYMNEIENAFTDLLPRGQEAQFNESSLMRMDTKTKTEVQTMQIAARLRDANELREEEGLEPLAAPKVQPIPESNNEGDSNDDGES